MAHVYTHPTWSTGRVIGLFAAVLLNVGFILAIQSGLDFRIPKIFKPDTEVVMIETAQVDVPEPVPVKPEMEVPEPAPVEMPMPEIDIPIETPPPEAVTAQTDPAPAETAPAVTELQADPRHVTPPVYPAMSRRLGEEGVVTLMIYVLPDGRVGDVRVHKSSGFARLDAAAVEAARNKWRFKPATQGGAGVAAWGSYTVRFQLQDGKG
jgi:protein TonB